MRLLLLTLITCALPAGELCAQWGLTTQLDTSMQFRAVEFINDSSIIAIGEYHNGNSTFSPMYVKSTDLGVTWDTTWFTDPSNGIPFLTAVEFPSTDTGYIAGLGTIYHTYDAGATWVQASSGSFPWQIRELSFLSNDVGYAIGVRGIYDFGLYKTVDAGQNWIQLSNDSVLTLGWIDSSIGFRGTADGLYVTTSGDAGWNYYLSDSTAYEFWDAAFPSANIAYILGIKSRQVMGGPATILARVENSGLDWSYITLPYQACYAISAPSDNTIYVSVWMGDSLGVIKSVDQGSTWSIEAVEAAPTFGVVWLMDCLDDSNCVGASWKGGYIWILND